MYNQTLSMIGGLLLLSSYVSNAQNISIPDANFKNALLNHNPTIDTNNDGEIQLIEALATTSMNVSMKNITNMSGIQSFVNLTELDCSQNNIGILDLSNNAKLEHLNLASISVANIDLSNNTALESLNISYTIIYAPLNLTTNIALQELVCENTRFTSLNLSNNLQLRTLNCSNGDSNFSTLDLSNNKALETLDCRSGYISSLVIGNNATLREIQCENNNIASLDISGVPSLTMLDCGDNGMKILDVSANTLLTELYCEENLLTVLDLSNNSLLTRVNCRDNKLAILGCSNNANLEYLDCSRNRIYSLDIANGNNPNLTTLNAEENNINLTCIRIDAGFTPPSQGWLEDNGVIYDATCAVVGIHETEGTIAINIFPNPAQDRIYITSNELIEDIVIYTVYGQEVLRTQNVNEVDIEHLINGMYVIEVRTTTGTLSQQFVKE